APGRVVQILQKIDPRSGSVLEETPRALRKGEAGIIQVQLLKPIVIERASDIPHMSRFAIRHGGQTLAAGICIDLVRAK
ncbi:MAG: hypothetical protein QW356_06370, partial [Candidatus Hadarchaeales archaeon]